MTSLIRSCLPTCFGLLALLLCIPARGAGQVNQEFQVTSENAGATVGDSLTLRFRVRLDERDLLVDSIPRPVGPLPDGVRVLSVEKMHRTPDRTFHGQARLAYYRPGRQPVPVFGLPFMRIVEGVRQATLLSDSTYVTIAQVLPAGNPALKDIREPPVRAGPPWAILFGAVLVLVLFLVLRRRRTRARVPIPLEVNQPVPVRATDPYTIAQEALRQVERAGWPAQGEEARHYQAVVDVLRDYLEVAEGIPARERTTGEVVWALPPHLSEHRLRQRFHDLLDEADLVKFAQARPGAPPAERFLERSRSILTHWHEARALDQSVDALR